MNVNFEYYKVFYHVAMEKSLTRACEKLNISQPAVSQSIKQLENALSVKLLRRTQRGVMLTKEGEMLFSYVKEGYQAFENAEKAIRAMTDVEAGEIVIGASDMTLQFFLLPYLEKFHEKYPKIKISVTNAPTPETLNNLKNRVIDFGVVSTPFDAKEGIKVTEVMDISDVFVAGRKYFKYKNRTLDFKDLESMPIIALEENSATRNYLNNLLGEYGVVIKPEFELATSDIIVQFALRNLGVGYVMKEFARPFLEDGTLFELRFRDMMPKRKFCIVSSQSGTLSTAAEKLLKMIEEINAND